MNLVDRRVTGLTWPEKVALVGESHSWIVVIQTRSSTTRLDLKTPSDLRAYKKFIDSDESLRQVEYRY